MISVDCLSIDEPPFLRAFTIFCEKAALLCGADESRDIDITLTDDENIRELNKTYRNKDSATDVLSFAFDDEKDPDWPRGEENPLGQIIISLNTLKINAEYFKVAEEEELKRLVIHGILHLMGEDHQTNNEEQEPMLQKQERLMKQVSDLAIYEKE